MAKLIPVDRSSVDDLLVLSSWEYEQILRLNAEVARIAGEDVEIDQGGPVLRLNSEIVDVSGEEVELGDSVSLILSAEKSDDTADNFCRRGLVKILTGRIVKRICNRRVQIIVDKADQNSSMAYDA